MCLSYSLSRPMARPLMNASCRPAILRKPSITVANSARNLRSPNGRQRSRASCVGSSSATQTVTISMKKGSLAMPKGPRGEKRPADMVGAAVMVAKIATGELTEELAAPRRRQCAQQVPVTPSAASIWSPPETLPPVGHPRWRRRLFGAIE